MNIVIFGNKNLNNVWEISMLESKQIGITGEVFSLLHIKHNTNNSVVGTEKTSKPIINVDQRSMVGI